MNTAPLTSDYAFGLNEAPDPALPEGGALLDLLGCGLCGSDLDKLLRQKSPVGTVLGHEVVGRIEALSPSHGTAFAVGDRIACAHHVPCGQCHFCLAGSESMCRQFKATNLIPGGFSQKIALSRLHLHHTVFKVPEHISDAEASCIEPLACVLHAVNKTAPLLHADITTPQVAIIGLGFIGLMAAQAYQNLGATVYGLDLQLERVTLGLAEEMISYGFTPPAGGVNCLEMLAEKSPTQKADLVFLTAVTPSTLEQALTLVRDGGTLVLFTSPNTPNTPLDPNTLYFREITVIPSYSPSLLALRQAAQGIFKGTLRVGPMITHTMGLDTLNEAVALYQSGEAIKVFITPEVASTPHTAKTLEPSTAS